MGCGESKAKEPQGEQANSRQEGSRNSFPNSPSNNGANENENLPPARAGEGDGPYANSTELPASHVRSDAAATHVDDDGTPVQLPKGVWVKAEGTPYYYNAEENLYYHPASFQFYDPTNQMWYDPEKNEWYHDE